MMNVRKAIKKIGGKKNATKGNPMICRTQALKDRLIRYYQLGEWDYLYIASSTTWFWDYTAKKHLPVMEYTLHITKDEIVIFQKFHSWFDLEDYANRLMIPRSADELIQMNTKKGENRGY